MNSSLTKQICIDTFRIASKSDVGAIVQLVNKAYRPEPGASGWIRFSLRSWQKSKMTPAKLRLAVASMGKPETNISDLCKELGITRQTLYRLLLLDVSLREDGEKLLKNT